MKPSHLINLLVLIFVLTLVAVSIAGVPQTINYQGYLKNTDGTPVSTATTIRFSLYSSTPPRNDNYVWRETKSITPANGIYSTQLGSVIPITAAFDAPYWLGVQAGADPEMPLQPLSSVPYAKRSATADSVSSSSQIISIVTTGTAPLSVVSTTVVPNLNADMLDGRHASDLVLKSGDTMTGDLTISGASINLPATTSDAGMIRQTGNRLLHTFGAQNFFAGINAGNLSTSGTGSNTAIGATALNAVSYGFANTATGNNALRLNSTGNWNTASGTNALYSNTSGTENTANGGSALVSNTTGNYNTASGAGALNNNTTGSNNTASGRYALMQNTTASNNTAIGVSTLYMQSYNNGDIAWDTWNTAVGSNALFANQPTSASTGMNNSAFGGMALMYNTTGAFNTASGVYALYNNTTGIGNSAIGYAADVISGNLTNATAIGYNAKVGQSYSMVLGGTGPDAVKVGIGTQAPTEVLDVVGNLKVSGTVIATTPIPASSLDLSGRVAKGGDTMTGTLNLPLNGLTVGTNQLVVSGGNIGIGISTPAAKLDVSGSVKATSFQGDGSGLTSVNAQAIGGQTIAQLDSRYASSMIQTPPIQNPRTNTITPLDFSGGQYTSITIGADGLPIISYFSFWDAGDKCLKVAKCANAVCSSATITKLDRSSAGNVGQYSSIAIGTDNLPIISYYDAVNGDLKVAKCSNSACTTAAYTTLDGSSADVGQFTSAAIGTDGLPIISYYDVTNGNLKVAKCTNTSCTDATFTTIDGASANVGKNTSIAIATDGLPIISYFDSDVGNLKVAKCSAADCSGTPTVTSIGSAGYSGYTTSIAIGADGLPVISFFNNGLKTAKCTNTTCSASTIYTLITGPDVGTYSALSIGVDGLPVISYSDYVTSGRLNVAKCSDINCASASTITVIDSTDNPGWYSSIAIGMDGLPIISYYDSYNAQLRVAKCANQFCVNNWSRR